MNPQRLLKILTHPLFIGLLITLAVFYFVPPVFSKYRVKIVENEYIEGNDLYYYEDLDDDQISEKIRFDTNNSDIIKILLYKGSNTASQNNLNYKTANGNYFYFGDFDNDGRKEVFVFSWHRDSVFLNILGLLPDDPWLLKDRFIDVGRSAFGETEIPIINPVGLTDYDRDGNNEFVFTLNSGFCKQPRNLYVYYISADSLVKSPESGASVLDPQFFDVDNDSVPEIVFGTNGVGNLDSTFPYSDQYAWLMVLDHNLDFIFRPVPFQGYPCRLHVVPVTTEAGSRLYALNDYFGSDSVASTISVFNEKGELLKRTDLHGYENGNACIFPASEEKGNAIYFIRDSRSVIEVLDSSLTLVKRIRGPEFYNAWPLASLDADGDGEKEYIFMGTKPGLFYVVRNNFSSYASFTIETLEPPYFRFCSVVKRDREKPRLYISFLHSGVTLEYARNPWYKFRYFILLALYLAVSGFIYLLFLVQRYRARMHFETARKITELQMKSIKNQIDPHFTLNILNAIGSLYATSDNRDTADYLFGKYARMLRQTVLNSDKVEVTLGEELEFVKNYLDLEKFRLNDKFDYSIEVGEGVDTTFPIPRMLIHTFAENAVKYAFRPVNGSGRLEIGITRQLAKYCITVTDNGPGLKGTGKIPSSATGKGLEILDEMIKLYYSLKKVKISYSLEDLMENGFCKGLRVVIEVF